MQPNISYFISPLKSPGLTLAPDLVGQAHTVMRIIKLKLFPVPVMLHSGSGKLKFRGYFTIFSDI